MNTHALTGKLKDRLIAFTICFAWSIQILVAAAADAPGDGLYRLIQSQLKDPAKPFTLLIHVKAKEGMAAQFEAAFSEAMKGSRKDKGCLAYDLNRVPDSPTDYVIYERWASLEAVKSHLEKAHVVKLLNRLPEVTEGAPKFEMLTPAGE